MLTGKLVRVRFARDHIIPQYLDAPSSRICYKQVSIRRDGQQPRRLEAFRIYIYVEAVRRFRQESVGPASLVGPVTSRLRRKRFRKIRLHAMRHLRVHGERHDRRQPSADCQPSQKTLH